MDDAFVETFRRIYTSIQRGDPDELTRSLTHDIEWTLPESVPWGGVHHGPLGVKAMVEIYSDLVDGYWADPDEFIQDGDRVVVLGRMTGEGRSSGQRFEVPFTHVWGLIDGVPSRFRAYYDSAPITAALEGAAS
ncbi:MAG TPA: nuclear transport factor 2 family protein [Solirubrobacterales bacterium]|nr:nuclear transport factor 2 family protein [Solirubrobacterales bacterium]